MSKTPITAAYRAEVLNRSAFQVWAKGPAFLAWHGWANVHRVSPSLTAFTAQALWKGGSPSDRRRLRVESAARIVRRLRRLQLNVLKSLFASCVEGLNGVVLRQQRSSNARLSADFSHWKRTMVMPFSFESISVYRAAQKPVHECLTASNHAKPQRLKGKMTLTIGVLDS